MSINHFFLLYHIVPNLNIDLNMIFKMYIKLVFLLFQMGDISLGSLLNDSPIKKSSSSDLQTNNLTGNSSSSCSSNSSSSSISSSLTLNSLFNDWSRDSSTSRMDVSILYLKTLLKILISPMYHSLIN